jgi:hypothetical protein
VRRLVLRREADIGDSELRVTGAWLCVVGVWNSLVAKGGRIFLITIPQYVSTFLRRVIIITQNSKIINRKKLAKHITPRQLYIPARPPDFIYHFTHPLFSCSNTLLLLLLISPSALTLSDLYFRKMSPE